MSIRRAVLWAGGYPLAIVGVAVLTAVCVPFREVFPVQTFMLVYVPLIVGVARVGGTRPASFAAVASVVGIDFFLVEPYHRLAVSRPAEWIALAVFLAIALIVGQQAGQLRDREREALRGQRELALLNRVSFRIVSDKSVDSTLEFLACQAADSLDADRAAIYVREGEDGANLVAASGSDAGVDEVDFMRWVMRNDKAIGLAADVPTAAEPRPVSVTPTAALEGRAADGVYLPLQTKMGLDGVLYARLGESKAATPDDTRFLVALANLASAALERQRLEGEALQLAAEHEADRLKSTFVSSVSHELKTPLAAATARVTGLLGETGEYDSARVREEMRAIAQELERLDDSIGDLVDVSRLESDAWLPMTDVYDVGEILGSVASKLGAERSKRVRFDIPEAVPFVEADFNQLVRAFENIIENALAYSPGDSPVTVRVAGSDRHVLVEVEDRGPGVPDNEKVRVFEKFYRGTAAASVPGGTGLGLAISREIVDSHGGRIWVEDAKPHGSCFWVELPIAVIGAESE